MSVVCIDTQIIIWGVRRTADSGQEDMIPRAESLIQQLEENRANVIIPSVVLGELLMGIEDDDHARFLALINQRFRIVPYDAAASVLFARMWKAWRNLNPVPDSEFRITKAEMKADFMIVATARAKGADCIYSEDNKLRRFAEGNILVSGLPAVMQQTNLF